MRGNARALPEAKRASSQRRRRRRHRRRRKAASKDDRRNFLLRPLLRLDPNSGRLGCPRPGGPWAASASTSTSSSVAVAFLSPCPHVDEQGPCNQHNINNNKNISWRGCVFLLQTSGTKSTSHLWFFFRKFRFFSTTPVFLDQLFARADVLSASACCAQQYPVFFRTDSLSTLTRTFFENNPVRREPAD